MYPFSMSVTTTHDIYIGYFVNIPGETTFIKMPIWQSAEDKLYVKLCEVVEQDVVAKASEGEGT